MDAKKGVNGSQEQHDLPAHVLPASLAEALMYAACVQQETNKLLLQLVTQNQQFLTAFLDEPDDAEPREDMEGRPIKDS